MEEPPEFPEDSCEEELNQTDNAKRAQEKHLIF